MVDEVTINAELWLNFHQILLFLVAHSTKYRWNLKSLVVVNSVTKGCHFCKKQEKSQTIPLLFTWMEGCEHNVVLLDCHRNFVPFLVLKAGQDANLSFMSMGCLVFLKFKFWGISLPNCYLFWLVNGCYPWSADKDPVEGFMSGPSCILKVLVVNLQLLFKALSLATEVVPHSRYVHSAKLKNDKAIEKPVNKITTRSIVHELFILLEWWEVIGDLPTVDHLLSFA